MFNSFSDTMRGPEYREMRRRAYEKAASELEEGHKEKGLWAKALADSNFEQKQASKLYLEYRVEAIMDQAELEARRRAYNAPKNIQEHSKKLQNQPEQSGSSILKKTRSIIFWVGLIFLITFALNSF